MHDVALWRAADKVKRITSDQRERRHGAWPQDVNLFGADNVNCINDVSVRPISPLKVYRVTQCDIFQPTKEAVSMPCDADVPWLSGSRSSGNPSYRVVQSQSVRPIKHGHFEPDFRNVEYAQRSAGFSVKALFIGVNSMFVPLAEIDAGWICIFRNPIASLTRQWSHCSELVQSSP